MKKKYGVTVTSLIENHGLLFLVRKILKKFIGTPEDINIELVKVADHN